jgi:predicted membrane metal-binding protein
MGRLGMIIALLVFCFLQLLLLGVCGITLFYTLRSNFVLQRQNETYKDFIEQISSVLESDIDLFRAQLAKKLSMDIPEVHELSSLLSRLRDNITRVKHAASTVSKEE